MTLFSLPETPLSVLQRTLSLILPGIEDHELYSTASILAIIGRGDKSRIRNTQSDAELTRNHTLLVSRRHDTLRFQGCGISDRSCRVIYDIETSDEGEDFEIGLDPNSIFCPEGAVPSFERKENSGQSQLVYFKRKATIANRILSKSVRGLRQETVDELTTFLDEEKITLDRVNDSEDVISFLSDLEMVRSLASISDLVDTDISSFCSVELKDSMYVGSWPIIGQGLGCLWKESKGEFEDLGGPVIFNFGSLRLLRQLLDRFKEVEITDIKFNMISMSWHFDFVFQNMRVHISWTRESQIVTEMADSQDRAIGLTKTTSRFLSTADRTDKGIRISLATLAEGLDMASEITVPENLPQGYNHSGVQVHLYGSEDPGYLFLSRNMDQSIIFRLGNFYSKTEVPLVFTLNTKLAESISRSIKALSKVYQIKEMTISIIEINKFSILFFKGTDRGDMGIGFFLPNCPPVSLLFQEQKIVPKREGFHSVIRAEDLLESSELIFSFATAPAFAMCRKEEPEPSLLILGKERLLIEIGSRHHVMGNIIPVVKSELGDKKNRGITIKSTVFKDSLHLLYRIHELLKKSPEYVGGSIILLQIETDHDTPAFFATLVDKGVVIARISSRIAMTVTEDLTTLPSFRSISPYWSKLEMDTLDPFPPLEVEALSRIHNAYMLRKEEWEDLNRVLLTQMVYDPEKKAVIVAGSNQAIRWDVDSRVHGDKVTVFPMGFFAFMERLNTKDTVASYTVTRDRAYIRGKKLYAVWSKPDNGSGREYPKDLVLRFLNGSRPSEPERDGWVHGLGTDGNIEADVSLGDLLEAVEEAQVEGVFSRFFWLWDEKGRHIVLPDYNLSSTTELPSTMGSDVKKFRCDAPFFCMGLQRAYFATILKETIGAEALLGDLPEILRFQLLPNRVVVEGNRFKTVILPTQISEEERRILSELDPFT